MKRYQVIERFVKRNGWTSGAEIGVYKGDTFFYLLKHCPNLNLIGVDSWYASPKPRVKDTTLGISSWKSPEEMAKHAENVKFMAEKYSRATVYHMDSLEAADLVRDGSLDFIFVDGEHTTEAVLSDVRAWSPKVKKGGWILGHDAQWISVRRALKELFPKWRTHSDNVWSCP